MYLVDELTIARTNTETPVAEAPITETSITQICFAKLPVAGTSK